MKKSQIIAKAARVSDILEQIEQLNKMVDFHENESKEPVMMRQYEALRKDFIKELENLLAEFNLSAKINLKAA